jgi:hypothetical protein
MAFSSRSAAERLAAQVDIDSVAGLLGARKDELRALVSREVHSAISSRNTGELLTLKVTEGGRVRTLSPSPTVDYAKYLFRYMRGGAGDGISCAVEDVVEKAVMAAVEKFYQGEETLRALSENLAGQLRERAEIHRVLEEELREAGVFARDQIKDAVQVSGGTTLGERLVGELGQGVAHGVQQTALGGAFAALLAKALALPVVQAAVVKALGVVLANAAFQKAVVLVTKKIGIALFVKLALVKLVGVGAGALTAVIVIPIIIGILVHQWVTFPKKIADKVSGEVAAKLAAESGTLNEKVAAAFVTAALDKLLEYLHDELLKTDS